MEFGTTSLSRTGIAHDSDLEKPGLTNNFAILVQQADEILSKFGEQFNSERPRLGALKSRFDEGRFHLAVLGQFKRGKSTLLNALIGYPLLPTSVVPLTAIPTFVEYGERIRIKIVFREDKPTEDFVGIEAWEAVSILQKFVTEDANPKNILGVEQVDIFFPAEFLQHGVVLIDTPGIGSTYTHNTQATLNFLPECDAALFVVSADPPLTEVEADFLTAVRSGIDRLFFIFNKIDYLNEAEKSVAISFFEKILKEKTGAGDHFVFCVSARNGLDAKATENHELWTESGMAELERYLIKFLAAEKLTTLLEALKKQAADIISNCSMRLSLTAASLKMPLTDLEQRIGVFDCELKRAETDRISTQDLLSGERKRSIAKLEQEAESLRLTSAKQLSNVVENSMIIMEEDDISEKLILDSIAEELTSYFDISSERLTRELGMLVKQTLRSHQLRVDELIEGIRKTASELFDIPYHAPDSDQAFETKRRPTWVLRKRVPSLPIIIPEETIDRLLPKAIRMARLKKRLSRQIASLVHHNVENLRWATLQNVNDAFHRFARMIDDRFKDTISATHGAIQTAYLKRKEHSEAIADEQTKTELAIKELSELIVILRR